MDLLEELELIFASAAEQHMHEYLSRGFELTAEESHHSFGVDLIGQVYELPLR